MSSEEPASLAIDFGTTTTCAGFIDENNRGVLVPTNDKGDPLLPSACWFGPGGEVLVGKPALDRASDTQLASGTVLGIKRFLGRRYASDFVQRNATRFAYPLVAGPGGEAAMDMHGRVRTFVEATFHVLKRIYELADIAAGRPFESCVLTVPAHAGFRQRRALRTAAEMTGLEVKAVINEPTAAAIALLSSAGSGLFLICDVGGGTVDVTLLDVAQGRLHILASGGEAFLGGFDFDARLADLIIERFAQRSRVDLTTDRVARQRVLLAAERAKVALSHDLSTRISVPAIAPVPNSDGEGGFLSLHDELQRADLERVTGGLVEQILGICDEVVARAKVPPQAVRSVLFVGGQTLMPLLRQRVGDRFPVPLAGALPPQTAVVQGAAIAGRYLVQLFDVFPMTITAMVPGATAELVPASARLPFATTVALPQRPPGACTMAFFESVSATSTERELIASARIDGAWLERNPGPLRLSVTMNNGLDLSVRISADGEMWTPLLLESR